MGREVPATFTLPSISPLPPSQDNRGLERVARASRDTADRVVPATRTYFSPSRALGAALSVREARRGLWQLQAKPSSLFFTETGLSRRPALWGPSGPRAHPGETCVGWERPLSPGGLLPAVPQGSA